MSTQSGEPKKSRGATRVAIPAGLLIGLGVGFLVDHVVAGVLIGLGAGFLVMMILRIRIGEWRNSFMGRLPFHAYALNSEW